ncbi:hypothetical protein [Legionella gresilensis]|uniref:hypothetical protein n=1 Tax=Legionella gresilensis TaxID=91823 RepID=UPI00104118DD|nr:hypothetical protein [Legionella gresilensis]
MAYSITHASLQFNQLPKQIDAFLQESKPLTANELNNLVTNNTIVGHTCKSHSLYELFFTKDSKLIFRKARDNKQVYVGRWWTKGNHIFSQWKSYSKISFI